ncbi:MAG: NHL repeat-containing protein, partial [Metallibacterium sp.]
MPKKLDVSFGFLNNQSINEVVGLNIAYSNSNYGGENFPSAYCNISPAGIAFDAFGNLWAADNYRFAILMYPPENQYNGAPATFQIGQPNLNVSESNHGNTQSSFSSPSYIAFDRNNNLWVVDTYNGYYNRILGFKYPFGSGGILNASWVIGQPNFTTAILGTSANTFNYNANLEQLHIVFDKQNNLWVADSANNRVLGFASKNIYSINPSASWVIGQPNFTTATSNNGGTTAKSLISPEAVAVDNNGFLWVADNYGNNRLLCYKNPCSIMPAADSVLGQPNFTTQGNAITQSEFTIINPSSITFDSKNNLWVYDIGNYRALGFASVDIYTNGANASWVMFQPNFTTAATATLAQGYTMEYDMAGFFYQVAIPSQL